MNNQDSSPLDRIDVRCTSAKPPRDVDGYEERHQLVVARPLPSDASSAAPNCTSWSRLPIRRSRTWSVVANFQDVSI